MNDKLFVYGVFLCPKWRDEYGMTNPRYATVRGYATIGNHIVHAVEDEKYTLTGLIVDVEPSMWEQIDYLEGAYDRIEIKTARGDACYM